MSINFIISIVLGYLIGAIPFTQIVAKWRKGIDLREVGSKNVGGMNTINTIGLGWGLFAGILDVLKGILSLIVPNGIGVEYPVSIWAGLAAIAGHNWPIWLGFRGGKGIATAIGLCLYVAPAETLTAFVAAFMLYWVVKRNIVITALVLFITTAVLMIRNGYPSEATAIVWGSILIMLIASFPSILRTFRSPGGLKGYMSNPNEVYEDKKKNK